MILGMYYKPLSQLQKWNLVEQCCLLKKLAKVPPRGDKNIALGLSVIRFLRQRESDSYLPVVMRNHFGVLRSNRNLDNNCLT